MIPSAQAIEDLDLVPAAPAFRMNEVDHLLLRKLTVNSRVS